MPKSTDTKQADAGAQTRAVLIEAARSSFARRGFDGTSVRTITGAAGANLGAITYHFGSKRALYEAVLEDGLQPLAERVRAAAAEDGTALDRIAAVVRAYFAHLSRNPDLPHLLLQEIAAGKQPPPVIFRVVGELKDTLSGLALEGERDGSVRPGHPVLTALSIVAQPIYLNLVAPLIRSVAHIDLQDGATREVAVEHAVEFVRRALEPRKE